MNRATALVGRRDELALLTGALFRRTGPRVVVVIGEAGVGKTRLIVEAATRARAAGVAVLFGACLPLMENVPFLPVTEALRLIGSAGKTAFPLEVLRRCPAHVRAELARLMPGWSGVAETADDDIGGEWQRARVFAAVRDLLATLSTVRPCALVVEDLHWADPTTLDFLAYLAAVDQDGTTPLLLSCREEELDTTRPVGRWFAEVSRRDGVAEVQLGRLSRSEVAEKVRALLATPAPDSFIDEVFARGGGNAFFTEQVVAAATAGDGAPRLGALLPASLARLLIGQAAAVGGDGWNVLAALALAGRGLEEPALEAITGLLSASLRVALRRLIDVHLIDRPAADGPYGLRHALVGEAVVAELLPSERQERHAAIARALVATAAADRPAEVAEHWAEAGQREEEMRWRLAAAEAADRLYAHRESANQWQRLISLWAEVPDDARPPGLDLSTAYLNALNALHRCGDATRAGSLAEEAVERLAASRDRRRLALLHERAAYYRCYEEPAASLPQLEIALNLLADLPLGREHAVVLGTQADVLRALGRAGEAGPYLEQALRAARVAGATFDEVKILSELGPLELSEGDFNTGMERIDRAAMLAERHDDYSAAVLVAISRSDTLLRVGRPEEAAAAAEAGLDAARRGGLEQYFFAGVLVWNLFESLAEIGRARDAESAIHRATRSPPMVDDWTAHAARAQLDMLAGDLAAATDRWAAIAAVYHPITIEQTRDQLLARASIDLWGHRPAEALARIEGDVERIAKSDEDRFSGPFLTVAIRACADLAETARARRDISGEEHSQRAAQRLVEVHDAMSRDPFEEHPLVATALADRATWVAELTRVAGAADADAWAAAANAWTSLRRPHRSAYALWRQAEALLNRERRTAEPGECLREAARAAHGHAPLLSEIRALARRARIDLGDAQPPAPAPEPSPGPYGLTPRETAVLRLVANGLTNAQVGAALFISEKTASVHVSNILRKLDVKSRTQAATLAERAGLVTDESP